MTPQQHYEEAERLLASYSSPKAPTVLTVTPIVLTQALVHAQLAYARNLEAEEDLRELRAAARLVVACWESGDLAAAVNVLASLLPEE